jgi:hypothetical protein
MPIQINGESVPDALVDEELARLLKSSRSSDKTLDEAGMQKFRLMAACGVVDRILIRQAAEKDTRPIAPDVVDAEMQAEMNRSNCRPGVNEEAMRRKAEQDLRLRRTMDELAGDAPRVREHATRKRTRNYLPGEWLYRHDADPDAYRLVRWHHVQYIHRGRNFGLVLLGPGKRVYVLLLLTRGAPGAAQHVP